jgi:predicted nucleic acid-binding Zn ribbon protein
MGDTPQYRKANPIPVENLLRPVVARMGSGTEIALVTLRKNWRTVVGEANARNSEPSSLRDGMLTVMVSSPVWMTQARFMKPSFIDAVNRFLSVRGTGIRDIHFMASSGKQEQT